MESPRHVAILRSMCEGFNGGTLHCVCGKPTSDPIHYKKWEIEGKNLVEWRGMNMLKEDKPKS